nr:hypothetical protein Itr_chr03CG10990 [Ipomoea trifida]
MWERSWVETQAILLQNENSPSIHKGNDEFVSKDVGNETQKEERKRGNDDAILFEPNHGKILEGGMHYVCLKEFVDAQRLGVYHKGKVNGHMVRSPFLCALMHGEIED